MFKWGKKDEEAVEKDEKDEKEVWEEDHKDALGTGV